MKVRIRKTLNNKTKMGNLIIMLKKKNDKEISKIKLSKNECISFGDASKFISKDNDLIESKIKKIIVFKTGKKRKSVI